PRALPLLPARSALRAEPARRPPPGALRGALLGARDLRRCRAGAARRQDLAAAGFAACVRAGRGRRRAAGRRADRGAPVRPWPRWRASWGGAGAWGGAGGGRGPRRRARGRRNEPPAVRRQQGASTEARRRRRTGTSVAGAAYRPGVRRSAATRRDAAPALDPSGLLGLLLGLPAGVEGPLRVYLVVADDERVRALPAGLSAAAARVHAARGSAAARGP